MPRVQAHWIKNLRTMVRQEHGRGWTIDGVTSGGIYKTRISLENPNGRTSCVLPLEWSAKNQTEILNAVKRIRSTMEERQINSLSKAAKFDLKLERDTKTNKPTLTGWEACKADFLKSRSDRRKTTLRDIEGRLKKAVLLLESKPKPKDSKELFEKYRDRYFTDKMPAGSSGRLQAVNVISQFLTHSFEEFGLDKVWLPPTKKYLSEKIILQSDRTSEEALTPPIQSNELESFMAVLEKEKNYSLRLCVGLMGCYGLRPSEFGVLTADNGKLFVGQVKRNINTMRRNKAAKPQRVIPVDPPNMKGEGARLLAQYESGLVKLPLAVSNAIKRVDKEFKETKKRSYKPIGDAIRQLLKRHWYWKNLEKQKAGLVPYSLRHGFAYRCHVEIENPISVTEVAGLMRHTPDTHTKHYARWIDEAALERAVERLTSDQKVKV